MTGPLVSSIKAFNSSPADVRNVSSPATPTLDENQIRPEETVPASAQVAITPSPEKRRVPFDVSNHPPKKRGTLDERLLNLNKEWIPGPWTPAFSADEKRVPAIRNILEPSVAERALAVKTVAEIVDAVMKAPIDENLFILKRESRLAHPGFGFVADLVVQAASESRRAENARAGKHRQENIEGAVISQRKPVRRHRESDRAASSHAGSSRHTSRRSRPCKELPPLLTAEFGQIWRERNAYKAIVAPTTTLKEEAVVRPRQRKSRAADSTGSATTRAKRDEGCSHVVPIHGTVVRDVSPKNSESNVRRTQADSLEDPLEFEILQNLAVPDDLTEAWTLPFSEEDWLGKAL